MNAAERAGIDPRALETWLLGLGIGAEPPFRLTRIGEGKSNLTLMLEDAAGRRWVLRRPPLGSLLASAHDVAREARILAALAGTGIAAPRPIALGGEPVCEAPLLLMEHVAGEALDREGAALGLSERARAAVGPALVARLAEIHSVDPSLVGLADLASHGNYAERQLRRWRRQWEGEKTRDLDAVEEVAERLEASLPEQTETRLVHGDFHQLNCLVDPATGAVSAILDWELCTLGEPLADLGTLLAYWSNAGGHPLGDPYALTRLDGFSAPAELVAEYERVSGRDVGAVGFWHALAYWKVAIIVEGVNRRRAQSAANASGLDSATVPLLLERAGQVLDGAVARR